MENSLVSIIIPVYNVENYLEECIQSVLNQTYNNIEIILIDDGSTDSSGEICDLYAKKDSRIRMIHQANKGLSVARNVGLDNAMGDYISFVDSDDCVPKDMIECLYSKLLENDVGMIKGNFQVFRSSINQVDTYDEKITLLNQREAVHDFICSKWKADKKVIVNVWNALYKKEVFDNIRFPVGKLYEDTYVTPLVLMKCDKIAHYNKVVYFYRNNLDGIMNRKFDEKIIESLDMWKTIHFLFSDKYPELGRYTCGFWIDKYLNIYRNLDEHPEFDNDNEVRKYIKRELLKNYIYFIKNKVSKMWILKMLMFFVCPHFTVKKC